MAVKVKDKDKGLFAVLANVREMAGLEARVGIQGKDAAKVHKGTPLTMAQVGAVHEYGSPAAGVPQRSFLRATIDASPDLWTEELSKQLKRVLKEGANPKQAFLVVAEKIRAAVIARIDDHIPPALADSTIARKGGETTPLVDTGALRGSISATVGEAKKGK